MLSNMLLKILDKLCMQMTLPVHVLELEENISATLPSNPMIENPRIHTWFELQDKLNIWSMHPSAPIYHILNLSHYFIESQQLPQFNEIEKQTQARFFWKRKTKIDNLSIDILFKFIFEKLKYFHSELLPQTKRPMDLFELFCPIEDAALEKRIIHLNDEHLSFFRSLNASALIYSAIFSFAPAMPELVAAQIQNSKHESKISFYESLINHPNYEPIYGNHPYLQNFNEHGFLMGLYELFTYILNEYSSSKLSEEEKIKECIDYLMFHEKNVLIHSNILAIKEKFPSKKIAFKCMDIIDIMNECN